MKAYKGFNKDMTCRGFQFEEGKEYVEERADLCERGFHACLSPLDTFRYYSPGSSVFHKVELDEVSPERKDDSKVCARKIKVGDRVSIGEMVKAQFEFVKSNTTAEHTDPKLANAGNRGAAISRGSSAVGENGVAVARGTEVKAKGGIGSILIIATENIDGSIGDWKAEVVDGDMIKPDTWYKLIDGEFVEE